MLQLWHKLAPYTVLQLRHYISTVIISFMHGLAPHSGSDHWPASGQCNASCRLPTQDHLGFKWIDQHLHASISVPSRTCMVERIGEVTHAAVARQALHATGRCLPPGRRTQCSRPPTQSATGRVPARPAGLIHGPAPGLPGALGLGMSCLTAWPATVALSARARPIQARGA